MKFIYLFNSIYIYVFIFAYVKYVRRFFFLQSKIISNFNKSFFYLFFFYYSKYLMDSILYMLSPF